MYTTEHYQCDTKVTGRVWDSQSHRTINVPLITAKPSYMVQITQASHELGRVGSRTKYDKALARVTDIKSRNPVIHQAKLHPDYDITCTGGPMGTNHLSSFSGLPPKLEDYTDLQVLELLRKLIVPAHEILELRELERMLRQDNSGYRNLFPV